MSTLETISQPKPNAVSLERMGMVDFAKKQVGDVKTIAKMSKKFGPINTAQSLYAWGRDRDEVGTMELHSEQLDFPVTIAKSLHDFANYLEITKDGVYELPKNLRETVDGLPIVDVGAYIGLSAVYFASRFPNSPVVAIEPSDRNQNLLRPNIEPYAGQITPVQAAVTVREGTVRNHFLGRRQNSHMANMFASNGVELGTKSEEVGVPALTIEGLLDQLDGERIGILKIDIEGAEKALFRSAGIGTLLDRTNILMVETHDAFVPGSDEAVKHATRVEGMIKEDFNSHTDTYVHRDLVS